MMYWISREASPPGKVSSLGPMTLATSWFFSPPVLCVDTTASILETKFFQFQHRITGKVEVRSLHPYSLNMEVARDIDFVAGVHHFTPQQWHHSRKVTPVHVTSQADNSPILSYLVPGSEQLSVFVGIRCLDGDIHSTKCQSSLKGVNVYLDGAVDSHQVQYECRPCSSWKGVYYSKCNQTNSLFNVSADTVVYCLSTHSDLNNYESYKMQLSAVFAEGETQRFTYEGSVILSEWVTPQLLQQYYKITYGPQATNSATTQSVAEFLEQYFSKKDLQEWFSLMGLKNQEVARVIGPNDETLPGGEASLDIQYIMGVAQNVATTFWSIPGRNQDDQEPFLVWLLAIQNDPNPPLVHSISYDDQENTIHETYIDRVEVEFIKAGLRGLSLLFASGDDGCGGYYLRTDPTCSQASPAWPSSSPYVTSVGGTQFLKDIYPWCKTGRTCTKVGEVVSSTLTGSRITTGGGFSNMFLRPQYQSKAVEYYVANTAMPPNSFYNVTGRAYPDISAVAHNYLVQLSGELIGVDGTSASTPTVAGMISLLNDFQLNSGRKPLGFLNPWIYNIYDTHPEAFNDIVVGDNKCSANPANCCPYGFAASPGWDASTGVGSPKFEVLLTHLPVSP
eukprot:TRINITY_DN4935_c0_g1_i3.p1 TRINITY_DN4935_c0_g1~~TRINITY_DN4935_c0_g1_i3.p1  ORF type:complete len:619 (-),score=89.84 TRINITY_DN4935_c0_g1_i3:58-1914(-)